MSGSSRSAAIRCWPCAWWSASARRSGSRCRWGRSSTIPTIGGLAATIALSGDGGARGAGRNVAPGPPVAPALGSARRSCSRGALVRPRRDRPDVSKEAPGPRLCTRPIPGSSHDVETIASEAVDALRDVQPQGPYDLVGDCLGGVLAFEIARQLTARGCVVGRLVLLDSLYPARRPGSKARAVGEGLDAGPRPVAQVPGGRPPAGGAEGATGGTWRHRGPAAPGRRAAVESAEVQREVHAPAGPLPSFGTWDGSSTTSSARANRERHSERAWEPHVAAMRVHPAAGDHVTYLRSRLEDNRDLLRLLLE